MVLFPGHGEWILGGGKDWTGKGDFRFCHIIRVVWVGTNSFRVEKLSTNFTNDWVISLCMDTWKSAQDLNQSRPNHRSWSISSPMVSQTLIRNHRGWVEDPISMTYWYQLRRGNLYVRKWRDYWRRAISVICRSVWPNVSGESQGGIPRTIKSRSQVYNLISDRFGIVGEHPVPEDSTIDAVILGKSQLLQSIGTQLQKTIAICTHNRESISIVIQL